MLALVYLANLATGALLCNGLPHLVAGLQGIPFPTPFAQPRGVGDSPPFLNMLWGLLNLFGGLCLLLTYPVSELGLHLAFVALGAVALGAYLSRHFGRVRQSKPPAA